MPSTTRCAWSRGREGSARRSPTTWAAGPGIALAVGLASVLTPRDVVLGERLAEGLSWRADWGRFASVGILLPVVATVAFGAGFSPFLYFQF